MNFFDKIGVMAISSRLRMLSERMTKQSVKIYELYGVSLQPKWFPVFYILSKGEEKTITGIAKEIGHSHPSVSKIVREMAKKGLLEERKGKMDARKNVIRLSAAGMEIKEKMLPQYEDVTNAIDEMLAASSHNLWKAIEEWEYLLAQKDLLTRIRTQKKQREAQDVEIIAYEPKYQTAFRDLNVEWISKYFIMEEADYLALDNPDSYILDKGGYIFMALYQGKAIGTCSLIKMEAGSYDYELAKMAVSPTAQGKGIGWLLGAAVIEKAKKLGGKTLFLESNTKLKPAISLYHKLGFKKVPQKSSVYKRSNIQMLMEL